MEQIVGMLETSQKAFCLEASLKLTHILQHRADLESQPW
jgi:hypothetical protein